GARKRSATRGRAPYAARTRTQPQLTPGPTSSTVLPVNGPTRRRACSTALRPARRAASASARRHSGLGSRRRRVIGGGRSRPPGPKRSTRRRYSHGDNAKRYVRPLSFGPVLSEVEKYNRSSRWE